MSKINQNAFPMYFKSNNGEFMQKGMTMRDWFAGMALCGLCSNLDRNFDTCGRTASDAYAFADEMIRQGGGQ